MHQVLDNSGIIRHNVNVTNVTTTLFTKELLRFIMFILHVHLQMFFGKSYNAAYDTRKHGNCRFFLLAMMLSVPNVKIFWVENGTFKVYIWQPFEARIVKIWRPNSGTPGLHFIF